jgi:hypothetical protein
MRRKSRYSWRLLAAMSAAVAMGLSAPGSSSQTDRTADRRSALRQALTFYASFDGRLDADFALGDARLYSAPSRGTRDQEKAGAPGGVQLAPGAGRHGDALRLHVGSKPLVYFKGGRNMPYQAENWSGTISFWMSLDPDEDLAPGYSDPLLITPRSWDDASLFVDFTRDDVPRRFRFAAFADKAAWNPEGREWDDVPVAERPMIEIVRPPFGRGRWTHVVMAFQRFNTGRPDGRLAGYLDGEPAGTLEGRRQTYTWTPDEDVLIALGIQYIGLIDELSIFNRALSHDDVRELHRLPEGIRSVLDMR